MSFVLQICMLCGKASRSRRLRNEHMTSEHVLCPVNLYVMWQSITEPPLKKQTHDKCSCPLSCKSVCYVAKPYRQKPSCSQWGWLQLGRHILETHEMDSHGVLEICCICQKYISLGNISTYDIEPFLFQVICLNFKCV